MAATETSYKGDELPSGTAQYVKISKPAGTLLLLYAGFCDLVDLVLKFVGMDDFWILDVLWFPVSQIYFRVKGVRGTSNMIMSGAEAIPYVGALPLRVVGCWLVLYHEKHPGALPLPSKKGLKKSRSLPSPKKTPPPPKTPSFSYGTSFGSSLGGPSEASSSNAPLAPSRSVQVSPKEEKGDILGEKELQANGGFQPFSSSPYVSPAFEDDKALPQNQIIDLSKKSSANVKS